MHDGSEQDTLFEFPCNFPVKAMGHSGVDLEITVQAIIGRHVPAKYQKEFKTIKSSNGRYISVTATIVAQSRGQLDAIYMDLSEHPDVLYAL